MFDAQPADLVVLAGQQGQFSVDGGGASGLQWHTEGASLSNGAGVNTDTLTILAAAERDEGRYACFVSSRRGNALSNSAQRTVEGAP